MRELVMIMMDRRRTMKKEKKERKEWSVEVRKLLMIMMDRRRTITRKKKTKQGVACGGERVTASRLLSQIPQRLTSAASNKVIKFSRVLGRKWWGKALFIFIFTNARVSLSFLYSFFSYFIFFTYFLYFFLFFESFIFIVLIYIFSTRTIHTCIPSFGQFSRTCKETAN